MQIWVLVLTVWPRASTSSFMGLSDHISEMGVGTMVPQGFLWLPQGFLWSPKDFLDSSSVWQQLFLPRSDILQLSEKYEWKGCGQRERGGAL